MTGRTERGRPGWETGAATTGQEVTPTLPEQAKQLIEHAKRCCPDFAVYAQGFVNGWDARDAAEETLMQQRLDALAEDIARHEQTPWVERGQFSRERRIAREVAEMERRAAEIRAEIYGGGS